LINLNRVLNEEEKDYLNTLDNYINKEATQEEIDLFLENNPLGLSAEVSFELETMTEEEFKEYEKKLDKEFDDLLFYIKREVNKVEEEIL
jgi:hypothetical protein